MTPSVISNSEHSIAWVPRGPKEDRQMAEKRAQRIPA
eukprot:CAMPEP_0175285154 /NCGR_PEP_ID=MMETSP0093-20121207/53086_1 /TAXON_ID=311494 /ORGANISM="Alexandrium monilatum, Strain CCMP3105" /LENGTH=36 /DNA_ID= /DNA_START= /DNA_END= /DNA_ORIENTATION=